LGKKREKEKEVIVDKVFEKEEGNSYKYQGMIAITLECNEFIGTYEVISILFIQLWLLCVHFYKGLIICLAS
jgi:hypothetical protein